MFRVLAGLVLACGLNALSISPASIYVNGAGGEGEIPIKIVSDRTAYVDLIVLDRPTALHDDGTVVNTYFIRANTTVREIFVFQFDKEGEFYLCSEYRVGGSFTRSCSVIRVLP